MGLTRLLAAVISVSLLGLSPLRSAATAAAETATTSVATTSSLTTLPSPALENREPPGVAGTPRYTRVLTADRGAWSARPERVSFRWLRDGEPIRGARGKRYRLGHRDVGQRVRVRVTVRREGFAPGTALSPPRSVLHRVPVRRTVRYSVAARGRVVIGVRRFARAAQRTYDDPRGWRGRGVRLVRVRRGGGFTLWISQAPRVPDFSPACSSYWSCRVGRDVVVNQDRWRWASPLWVAVGASRRDYRHLVVNHETGHWLGRRHAGCPGGGRLAPVMMQQSKALHGCRANPWPTRGELG